MKCQLFAAALMVCACAQKQDGNDIIVIDAGLSFPDDDMFGIDLVIPDMSYLIENRDKVRAVVITHGHEDHIGSLAYLLNEVNVPVYATKLVCGLIEGKLKENVLLSLLRLKNLIFFYVVSAGDIDNLQIPIPENVPHYILGFLR